MTGTLQGLIRLTIKLGVIAVVASVIARQFFVDVVVITHNGMAPTVVAGDEIAVWRGANVDMANVVVCPHPTRPSELVIGRAVVFAGHTIHTDYNGMLYVDNHRTSVTGGRTMMFYDVTRKRLYEMDEGHINYRGRHEHSFFAERGTTTHVPTYTVTAGVYLLGDNRSVSGYDSREFGEIDPETCIGQAFLRVKSAPSNDDDLRRAPIGFIK